MNAEAKLDSLIAQADEKMNAAKADKPLMEANKVSRYTLIDAYGGKYALTEQQINLIREALEMGEDNVAAQPGEAKPATLEGNRQVIDDIKSFIASGKFCSFTFVKKDGSLRLANVVKPPVSAQQNLVGSPRYNASDYNLITFWDNNAPNQQGTRGAFRNVNVSRFMLFKGGSKVYDFTAINAAALAQLQPEQQQRVQRALAGLIESKLNVIKVQ